MRKSKRLILAGHLSKTLLLALSACLSLPSCTGSADRDGSEAVPDTTIVSRAKAGRQEVLTQLRQCADIVTTEVTIRKVVVYDTSKSEHFTWSDMSTWKYGDRKCIIPIEVHVKYGYDMRDLTFDHIKLTDDSTAVTVELPRPKVVDAGYEAEIESGSVVSISTGMRSAIGHELEEEIRRKGYESILKEDLTKYVGDDIERNARTLFESIVKGLGFKEVTVKTHTRR